ncbi:MAG TPA: hypothetical protein VFU82_03195 [Gammaproteobacteria bacterium]|nr:hypothetical protein [Gammaproteobacteria bacterium]
MPNTERTHLSTEIINPVAAAFQHYIQQLHEQYPGVFTRFGADANDPYFETIKHTYTIDGRLFFDKFEVNKESFHFTHDPLSPDQIEKILDPINTACIHQGLSPFNNPKAIQMLLSQLAILRQAVFKAVLANIPEPTEALSHLKTVLNPLETPDAPQNKKFNEQTRRAITAQVSDFSRLIHAPLILIHTGVAESTAPKAMNENTPVISKLKQALRESAQLYLQETSNKLSLPPHEHLSQALTDNKDILQELMGFITVLAPQYTKEHIELLLNYRDKVNRAILTSDGINLLNGFFAYNGDNLKTPERIQAQTRMRVAGAVLFKVTAEAEKTLAESLSTPLKKFIAKVTNTASDNADTILATLQNEYKASLESQLSFSALRDYLMQGEENKERIQESIECFALKLDSLVKDDTFVAFHEHSFLVFFQTLLEECETLSDHPEEQRLCYAKILDVMIDQFNRFKNHAAAIPLAIRLLNAMHFPEKKHLRTNQDYKRHQDFLARCESQLSKEAFRKLLAEAKPMDKFGQLVRRVSQEVEHEAEQDLRKRERFNAHKIRSQSAFFNDNTQSSPELHRRHAITRFKTSLKRHATSHDGDIMPSTTSEAQPSSSPRSSPLNSRKKKQRSPETTRKQTSSSVSEQSPPTPKHPPKKSRKKTDPTIPDHYATQPSVLFSEASRPENTREVHEPSSRTLKANGRISRE